MMDPEAYRHLKSAHEFACRCSENLHGHPLYAQARQLQISLKQEMDSNPQPSSTAQLANLQSATKEPQPGSTEIIGGATIMHRPDLVYNDRVAAERAGTMPTADVEVPGYPPLRKGPVPSDVTNRTKPAEIAEEGLVRR